MSLLVEDVALIAISIKFERIEFLRLSSPISFFKNNSVTITKVLIEVLIPSS